MTNVSQSSHTADLVVLLATYYLFIIYYTVYAHVESFTVTVKNCKQALIYSNSTLDWVHMGEWFRIEVFTG